MRMRFWKLVHRLLESAWHWVYYNKVAPDVILISSVTPNYAYTIHFVDSRGNVTDPTP